MKEVKDDGSHSNVGNIEKSMYRRGMMKSVLAHQDVGCNGVWEKSRGHEEIM